jgi:putative transposase
MPRANRYHLPGHVWHLTHRCHQREFLLKFARDRDRYRHWLFEARKRFGLCVLDFVITSNHVHLLVKDTAPNVIAQSLQLVAGRTAQEYNQRKGGKARTGKTGTTPRLSRPTVTSRGAWRTSI